MKKTSRLAVIIFGAGAVIWTIKAILEIAYQTYEKYVMGSPLYRQEQDWMRKGIILSRQAMSGWLLRTAEDWLSPVYEAMKARLLTYDVLHADETAVQVLREPGRRAQSKSWTR